MKRFSFSLIIISTTIAAMDPIVTESNPKSEVFTKAKQLALISAVSRALKLPLEGMRFRDAFVTGTDRFFLITTPDISVVGKVDPEGIINSSFGSKGGSSSILEAAKGLVKIKSPRPHEYLYVTFGQQKKAEYMEVEFSDPQRNNFSVLRVGCHRGESPTLTIVPDNAPQEEQLCWGFCM